MKNCGVRVLKRRIFGFFNSSLKKDLNIIFSTKDAELNSA
jgi:hypothetical protein